MTLREGPPSLMWSPACMGSQYQSQDNDYYSLGAYCLVRKHLCVSQPHPCYAGRRLWSEYSVHYPAYSPGSLPCLVGVGRADGDLEGPLAVGISSIKHEN